MLKAGCGSLSLGLLPIASFWFLLCLSGCDVSWRDRGLDSPVGADLVEREPGGIVAFAPLAADSASSYKHYRGGLPYLLVGFEGDLAASALVKFSALPDTLDVQAARLELGVYAYHWTGPSQEISVKEVERSWTQEEDPAALPAVIQDTGGAITVADTMLDGQQVNLPLPLTMVQRWIDGGREVALLLEAVEGTGTCAFGSSEQTNGPALELDYTENDSLKTVSLAATEDTYWFSETQQVQGLLISQGEPARLQAYFGIETLKGSPDTTVVAATLTTHNLSPHPGATVELIAYEDGELAEEVGRTTVAQSDTAFSIALSKQAVQQMQSWLERPPASDYKLLLYLQGEGLGTSWLDIDAPALTLVYSVSPTVE